MKALGVLCFRLRAWDVHRVPRQGGFILAANHQSFLDPPLVGAPIGRQLCFMARRSLFDVPVLGPLIRAVNAFPVERDEADLGAMRTAIRVLRSGRGLVLFPEGTRSPDGEVRAFKPGFALLAARAGVPIVPAAVHGTFQAWPRHRRLPEPGHRVGVAYGEPLAPPAKDKVACQAAAAEVRRRILELLEGLKKRF